MNSQFDLLKLIKEDKSAVSNKEGVKPLLDLAEQIAVENNQDQLAFIENKIIEIDPELLTIEELNAYISFIPYSKIKSKKLFEKVYKTISKKRNKRDTQEIIKSALLLRFLTENYHEHLSVNNIIEQEEIRQTAAWIWIDCVERFSWNLAEDEIARLLSNNLDAKNLLLRLPMYIHNIPKEDLKNAFIKWYSNIKDSEEKKYLEKWALKLNIQLGLSIPAEYHLSKIVLYQKPVLANE